MATENISIDVTANVSRAVLAKVVSDPDLWPVVAERIGVHGYQYDLNDSSERLDVVQIVCEALAKVMGDKR